MTKYHIKPQRVQFKSQREIVDEQRQERTEILGKLYEKEKLNFFSNVPTFEWSELDGKTLQIHVVESKDELIVFGINSDGKCYVLYSKVIPECD